MRAIVNAVLSYGLVNVPVGVATAAKRKETSFRTLHADCGTPVKSRFYCETCASPVEPVEVVKGYEVAKGTFVHVPDGELDKLSEERSKVIAIKKFVHYDEVQELAVEKSYFLAPNDKLAAPYVLLSDAMDEIGVVGFGYQSLWGKETPAMVWVHPGGALCLSPLFCHDEIVSSEEIESVMTSTSSLVAEEAKKLAQQYVALNVTTFNPQEDLVSASRNRLDDFLASLVSGIDFEALVPEPAPEPTFDVLEQLKASIEQTRKAA